MQSQLPEAMCGIYPLSGCCTATAKVPPLPFPVQERRESASVEGTIGGSESNGLWLLRNHSIDPKESAEWFLRSHACLRQVAWASGAPLSMKIASCS